MQSLHKLKDTNNAGKCVLWNMRKSVGYEFANGTIIIEGAFFIFSDISIRIEGIFKLKFTLFEIKGYVYQF